MLQEPNEFLMGTAKQKDESDLPSGRKIILVIAFMVVLAIALIVFF